MSDEVKLTKRIEELIRSERGSCSEKMFGERKVIFERVLNETRTEPQVIRIARSLAAFLREKEIVVQENDLLAGHAQFCDCAYSNPGNTDEEIQKAISENDMGDKDRFTLEQFRIGTRMGLFYRAPSGHVIAGYDRILEQGLGSVVTKAKTKLAAGGNDFARASLIIGEAVNDYIRRYASAAGELAQKVEDQEYQAQLTKIVATCEWVSVHPPRNFFEAVQLLWLTHEVVIYEQYCGSMSLGRLDQYLFPYYARDITAGTLNYREAADIIEALWIKLSGLRKGYQNVTMGGIGLDGKYAVNDLSYICLRATKKLRMDQPLLSVRWHPSIPAKFWQEIQELIELGIGFPALFNDEVAIAAKQRLGIQPEDATNYGVIGCVEIAVPGKEYSHTEGFRINWAKVLELMLNRGVCTYSGECLALKNNHDLAEIKSFEEFYRWYRDELCYFLDLGIRGLNILDHQFPRHWPTPFLSSTMDGCLDNGRDVTGGGTVYNLSSVNGCGMANAADSLAAIQRIVYGEQKVSLPGLAEILRHDFRDAEILREELVHKCPKFGNDDDQPDHLMAGLTDDFCRQVESYHNPRGGCFQAGLYTVEAHAILGKLTGALPDGRRKGVALANALSPSQGADVLGPTAVIRSITKLNHKMLGNGMVLDLKFHPAFFNSQQHRQAFQSLIATYFQLGGLEVQFNVISRQTLVEAQKKPEDYRDLIVRVSGFSAYFVTLDRVLQDEIIARTEYAAI
jgi:pyruvate formate-lyase/glycerol dehydratase family glycyl radical enzyme